MSEKTKTILAALFLLCVIIAGIFILTPKFQQMNDNNNEVPLVSARQNLQVEAGVNTFIRNDGSVGFDVMPFTKAGESQVFSINLYNPNEERAYVAAIVEVNEKYFNVEYEKSFSIEEKSGYVYIIKLTLKDLPINEGENFPFNVSFAANYY